MTRAELNRAVARPTGDRGGDFLSYRLRMLWWCAEDQGSTTKVIGRVVIALAL